MGIVGKCRWARLGLLVLAALVSLGVLAQPGSAAIGDLSYHGCVSNDGSGGLCADTPGTPFSGADAEAVSPDGKSLYVTSFTSGTISHFFVGTQGKLSYDGCISNDGSGGLCADAPGTPLDGPTDVAVSPDGRSVYVVSQFSDDIVHFFAAPQGQLSYDGCISDGGSGGSCANAPRALSDPHGVAVSPDGRSVYVVSEVSNDVAHFFAAPQGQLTYDGCISDGGSGGLCADAPGELSGAAGVAVSPDGTSVYVASIGSATITHFFAAPQGQLSYDGCIGNAGSGGCADAPGAPLSGADDVVVSPDGHAVYATGFNSNDVVHFFAAPQGQLSYDGCISDGSGGTCVNAPGTPLTQAKSLAISPDGATVYVTSFAGSVLSRYSVASPGARLSYAGCASDDGSDGACTDLPGSPLNGAEDVVVSPNGASVYATAATASDVVHFFRTIAGGGGGGTGAPTLSGLTISPPSFAAAKSGGSVAKATGAKVSFTLGIAASVRFTVQRTVTGRRQNGKCVAPSHKNSHNKHCPRVVNLGSFTVNGVAGANSFHFTGRIDGHRLGPNGYTLVAVASANGKTSKQASVPFSVHR